MMSKTIAELNRAANAAWDKYEALLFEQARAEEAGRTEDANRLRSEKDEQYLIATIKSEIAKAEAEREKSNL